MQVEITSTFPGLKNYTVISTYINYWLIKLTTFMDQSKQKTNISIFTVIGIHCSIGTNSIQQTGFTKMVVIVLVFKNDGHTYWMLLKTGHWFREKKAVFALHWAI